MNGEATTTHPEFLGYTIAPHAGWECVRCREPYVQGAAWAIFDDEGNLDFIRTRDFCPCETLSRP